jgi:hypothetical protein
MAKVSAKVLGGEIQEIEATTVGEAKTQMGLEGNYSATVNGAAATDSTPLSDFQMINFSESVKGGC